MPPSGIVFLFDVDNTLLDNDRVTEDLQRYLEREVGQERKATAAAKAGCPISQLLNTTITMDAILEK